MAKAITAVIPIIILGIDDGFRLANYLMILRFSLQQGYLGGILSQITLVTFLTHIDGAH